MEATPTPAPTKAVAQSLQDATAELIHKSIQTAGDAKDFVVSQLPDVVQQLLAWKFAVSIIWFVLGITFFVTSLMVLRRSLKDEVFKDDKSKAYDIHPQHGWPRFIIGLASILCSVIGLLWVLKGATGDWLQIWLAPKVYLIEYARQFIK